MGKEPKHYFYKLSTEHIIGEIISRFNGLESMIDASILIYVCEEEKTHKTELFEYYYLRKTLFSNKLDFIIHAFYLIFPNDITYINKVQHLTQKLSELRNKIAHKDVVQNKLGVPLEIMEKTILTHKNGKSKSLVEHKIIISIPDLIIIDNQFSAVMDFFGVFEIFWRENKTFDKKKTHTLKDTLFAFESNFYDAVFDRDKYLNNKEIGVFNINLP